MNISNNGKILIGISTIAIGYLLYKQYTSNKINNAVKAIDNANAGNNGTTSPDTRNTIIANNCKTLAPNLKKCQNPQGLPTFVSKVYCDIIAPYQKMCAPYI
jgi:hypothetical protein